MKAFSPRRSTLIALGVGGLLSAGLAGTLAWKALDARNTTLEITRIHLEQFAQVSGDQTARAMEMADMVMVAGTAMLKASGADHHRALKDLAVFIPGADTIQYFDGSGKLQADSRSAHPTAPRADTEYFFGLHRDGGAAFNIDQPRRIDGVWTIPVSRRLNGPQGEFAGVVRVMLSADQLGDSYRSQDTSDADRVFLVGADETIYADSAPRGQRMVGRAIRDLAPAFKHWNSLAHGHDSIATRDTLWSIYHVPDFPFHLVASRDKHQALTAWRPFAALMLAGAMLVVIGAGVAGFAIYRNEGRRAVLLESLRLRERAIASVGNGVVITDARAPDHPIIYANPAFERLTGYSLDEVAGSNPRFLHRPDPDQPALNDIRTALDSDRETLVTLRNFRKDGTSYWCELLITPVRDHKGRVTHHLGVQRDITERMDAAERMRHANADLAASNADLEQFAYVASHDLQEPLRMVASYVQLLERRYSDQLDDQAREFIGFAVDGVKRMQELIVDLLEYSRISRKGAAFVPVDLNACLDYALTDLRVAIAESGATIDAAPLPTVTGDAKQLRRLLENLVGNAIKYRAPDRPPTVSITAGRDGDTWRIAIADNGIGIDPQYFDRIFVLFQRLHSREHYQGTGIGLAVCKKIAERHGGTVEVASAEGQGSTFTIVLPVSE